MYVERVACGVDGSAAGRGAAVVAARLATGALTLIAVVDEWDVLAAGPEDEARREPVRAAQRALETARAVARTDAEVATRIAHGSPRHVLVAESRRAGATLLVVGSHGQGRLAGIIAGSVAAALVHDSPISVLVSRDEEAAAVGFPRRVIVGVDGSDGSQLALEAAREIAQRCSAPLQALTAAADAALPDDLDDLQSTVVPGTPVSVLRAAAAPGDLIVVGSRGRRGLRALGSTSEQLAHGAPCSVLVVRPPAPTRESSRGGVVAADLMSAPVITVGPDESLAVVARWMVDDRIEMIPVVEGDHALIGLVTHEVFDLDPAAKHRRIERSPLTLLQGTRAPGEALGALRARLAGLTVRDVMIPPRTTTTVDETIDTVVDRMTASGLLRMPVLENERVVGMISLRDVLRYALDGTDL